jgi:ketosteroid isomerase-like protein
MKSFRIEVQVKSMLCPNCGKEVPEGSAFCPFCGFKTTSEGKISVEDAVRNVLVWRIEGIKNRDVNTIEKLVYKETYTKFDDWPPFELQGSEALKNEADALQVLKEYNYETWAWKTQIFENCALVTCVISYKGKIRDLSFNVQSRITALLVKRDEEWRIVHEHWSRFPTLHEKE